MPEKLAAFAVFFELDESVLSMLQLSRTLKTWVSASAKRELIIPSSLSQSTIKCSSRRLRADLNATNGRRFP